MNKIRTWIQLAYVAITNGYAKGLTSGTIYQGKGKQVCLPGLNCYSCPGALGSCPIGALQSLLTPAEKSFPSYVLGFLLLFGLCLGRVVCGFLCPFGLVQDLIYKLRPKKMTFTIQLPSIFRKLPMVILTVFVLGIPLFVTNQFNISSPAFCKWICPSGTLLGGLPLLSTNEGLRSAIGDLFSWKLLVLVLILLWSFVEYRPFCKYICPLGFIYGLFHSFSLYRMEYTPSQCIHCNRCEKVCKMNIPVTKTPNSPQCIRCGDCVKVCPTKALHMGFFSETTKSNLSINNTNSLDSPP